MKIQQLIQNQLAYRNEATKAFRVGQIIPGQVLKLFPHNMAQIQLGTNQFIAQLNASLEIGERYYFQVEKKETVPHLKVLGDAVNKQSMNNITILLEQLQLKPKKRNQSFVELLLREKIPFDKNQLQKALSLLDGTANRAVGQLVLREMIRNKIPLTSSVFQSILSRALHKFSEQLIAFEEGLLKYEGNTIEHKQILLEQVQRILGKTGLESELKRTMEKLEQTGILSPKELNHVKTLIANWRVNATSLDTTLTQFFTFLHNRSEQGNADRWIHQFWKELFLSQIRYVLQNVGLQYEKNILHDDKNSATTIKGLLIPFIQAADSSVQEQGAKLLQFIQGLQLTSIQENDSFIQANLVIPMVPFGLKNDIELMFEGKKNESGEINSDFCHIVFYLDLTNLEKTIIDMQVQKRAVSLVIFNDYPIEQIINSLKPVLKEGLEKIGYHFSNVNVQRLTNEEHSLMKQKPVTKTPPSSFQGVDIKI